ncbi:polysaccharide deacetylase family protein [Paenibacillus sp. MBLB4367]|uniref:polysaccharide deacetylase family protein n=1 Tax=Paenibacillus sp. MBLB4367 TaxID=3384767 RepID=UPI0039080292
MIKNAFAFAGIGAGFSIRKWLVTLLCVGLLLSWFGFGKPVYAGGDEKEGSEESLARIYEKLSTGRRVEAGAGNRAAFVPEETTVYLTFDDGPSANTAKVLDILREEEVPATFFVLGQMAEQQPDMVKRILEEGHALGNHSYNHVYKELYGDFRVFWKQLQQTEDALERIAGVRPTLVRAPGGTATNFDPFYFYYLDTAGYQVHDWNVDSGDSKRTGVPAGEIVRTVKDSPIRTQTVVLMHDGTGHAETAKALPDIIRYYKEKGVKFASLDPETKPVQFSLYKPKWTREVSYGQFVKSSEEANVSAERKRAANEAVQERQKREEEAELKHQAEVAAEEAEMALRELEARMPLIISTGDGEWKLEGGQYAFDRGMFAVPLSGLAGKLGASYTEDRPGKAFVRLGQRVLVYDAAKRTITEYGVNRKPSVHTLADVREANGELFVPLRATVELLGGRIAGYELGRESRTVAVWAGRDGLGLTLPGDPEQAFAGARLNGAAG